MISQSGCKKHVTFGNQQKIWVNGETSLGKLLLFDSFRHKQYGRVSRSSGLAKTVLQGTVKGGKKARQTGVEEQRQHQGMDRPGEKWRELVVKSSLVSQWPSHLRNRWKKEVSSRLAMNVQWRLHRIVSSIWFSHCTCYRVVSASFFCVCVLFLFCFVLLHCFRRCGLGGGGGTDWGAK